MTIYLDVSSAVHRRAGLGRYAENLCRSLGALIPDSLGLFYNREEGVELLPGLEGLRCRTVALGYKPWRMLVWAGQVGGIGFDALLPQARLFHATEHLLLPLRGIPTVLTVHDLIFHHLPECHKPLNRWYLNLTMPLYCRRATHIIAVSEATRRDLMALYGIEPSKIDVVYEAADPTFCVPPPAAVAAASARYGLPDRYLLFVGTVEPRKNLRRLLQAFGDLHAQRLVDALVIVGRRGWLYADFFADLERLPARQAVLFPGYVPDGDLPAIYAGARALVLPSLYEGFGLPVLEAMACGTPVVCSRSSSLPEVAGEAALLIDPTDVQALEAGLASVLQDEAVRQEMRTRGLVQAGRFTWQRAARETLAVYQRLLEAR